MRLGAYVAELAAGLAGGRGLRRAGRLRAPPPPLRVQPAATAAAFEDAGLRVLGHVARRPAGRVHRARRPPVLGRHPGPPRVQEPARPPAPLFREFVGAALAPGRGPQPAPVRPRRDDARTADGRRSRGADRAAGVPQARRARASTRAHVDHGRPSATLRGARRRARSSATSSATRARWRWCRCSTTATRSCWCASTGPPLDARPARDPGRHARRRRRAARASPPRRELAEEVGMRGRPARAAGRVPQLAGLQRRALARVPRHRPRPTCAHDRAGPRGAAHDRSSASPLDDVPAHDRRRRASPTPRRSSACCSRCALGAER